MSTLTKAHGMDGTLVNPDWPALTLDEVRCELAKFKNVAKPVKIVSVSPRPFSAASVVATRDGCVFVKRHHRTVRDKEALREEHRFMVHLRAHGFPVPCVFSTITGDTAVESAEWTYEVHELPAGIDQYQNAPSWTPFRSLEHARSAGRVLAQLHLAADGYTAAPRPPRPLVASFTIFSAEEPRHAMEEYLSARPSLASSVAIRRDCTEALDLLAPFYAELQPQLPALKSIWTHNDLHASNLFWSDASNTAHACAVIDFGLADRTNAVYDLAQAIERNIVEWLLLVQSPKRSEQTPVHLDHLHALLEGYESARLLSAAEASALAPMTALCHAEFALTEADYFLGVLHSGEKARVATHDYLVGHARWFRGSGGTRLLEELRKWAAGRERPAVRE